MRYLVGTDGSEESNEAVRFASQHALAFDATLEILHVLQPDPELKNGEIILPGGSKATEHANQLLEDARQLAARTVEDSADGLAIQTELLTGRPAAEIADRARETEADTIYVGHRGLSEERQQVVGSVAKSVIDKVTVPVTIVR
ncbi:universal stress protein [Halorhabdus salina]|uniref:universal stress protein n=1 Tax=Halorhabdus salina TaxID=2750670 RepID=UPI0015EE941C|nr:universal stress protein [Halorhabdus salina]